MTLQKLFDPIGKWMIRTYGYINAVHFKDFMTGLMTFILGMLLMAFISSYFILRLQSIQDLGKSKVKFFSIARNDKSKIILTIPNIWTAFEALLFLSFSPFCRINTFTNRDAKRTRRFVITVQVIVLVIILFTVFINSVVLMPPT